MNDEREPSPPPEAAPPREGEAAARGRRIVRVTLAGAAVNALLAAGKFAAGVLGRSAALVADAAHSLSDLATDAAVLLFVRVAARPPDEDHDFGHGKFETFATFLISLALFGVAAALLRDGAARALAAFRAPGSAAPPGGIAVAAAAVSVAAKELLYRWTRREGERLRAPAVVANAWHHRSDALSSVGALAGVAAARFGGPGWAVLDPLAAVAVALLVAWSAWELAAPAVGELLERSLPADVEAELLRLVAEDPAVRDPHNLRTRRIGAGIAVEVHVRVDPSLTVRESHDIAHGVEDRIRARHGEWAHVIVHVEPDKAR
jgi:cation diffusion facilitator family transporter